MIGGKIARKPRIRARARSLRTTLIALTILVSYAGFVPTADSQSVTCSGKVPHRRDWRQLQIHGCYRPQGPSSATAPMVYVFDAHEEMQQCCGCPVTAV